MKRTLIAAAGLLVVFGPALACGQQEKPAAKAAAPKAASTADLRKDASYCIGLGFARNIKQQSIEIDAEQLVQGFKDALEGKPRLTDAEVTAVMEKFQNAYVAEQQAKAQAAAEVNKKAGADYLAANKKKPGVRLTASGVQVETLKAGDGASPKETDTVKVHYKGTLIDGTQFDSSYDRGEPATFGLKQVIKGWTEGVQQLKVGEKARLVIPAELAYGDNPPPSSEIGPGSVLVFEIELLSIEK